MRLFVWPDLHGSVRALVSTYLRDTACRRVQTGSARGMGWLSIMAMHNNDAGHRHLWAILQAHIDAQVYPPSRRQLAVRLGVAPQTLNNWHKGLTALPHRDHLQAVADLTGTPYRDVLRAALLDAGYEVADSDDNPGTRAGSA